MRVITLTNSTSHHTILDDEDYDKVMAIGTWRLLLGSHDNRYAVSKGAPNVILMHHVILPPPSGFEVDHVDNDGLNNCRSNLRLADNFQQSWNRGRNKNNTTGYKGVFFYSNPNLRKPYEAKIMCRGKLHRLGFFLTAEEAAHAYNEAAKRLHGEFAHINMV